MWFSLTTILVILAALTKWEFRKAGPYLKLASWRTMATRNGTHSRIKILRWALHVSKCVQACQVPLKIGERFLQYWSTSVHLIFQELQTIIDARAKALIALGVKEDRLNAVNVIKDFWHNRRKKYNQEQEALAQDGKQVHVSEVMHIVLLCRWLSEWNFCWNERLPSTYSMSWAMWCAML